MSRPALLLSLLLLGVPASPARAQVIINEYFSGTPDFWELLNTGTTPVDISGWRVDTWYALSASAPVTDTSFTFPAGTILPPDGFVIGQDDSLGSGPTVFYVGTNLYWIAARTIEIALFDATGAGVDYVYGDYFGFGPSPHRPANQTWTGTFLPNGVDDDCYRAAKLDTNSGADWFNGPQKTPNWFNPGQGPQPPITGVFFNEFFTGAIPAVEIYNSTTEAIDVSGFILASWTDPGGGLVADPTFVIPAGTTLAAGAFLVFEAGGTAGAPGTYPKSIQTGVAYGWNGTMTVELALLDDQGVFAQGVDYVIYDHFGTIAGAGPNLPSPTPWSGDFDTGAGDTHERVLVGDTNTATDWAKTTAPHSLGSYNPPQYSGTVGVVINEFNTAVPDYCELLNGTTAPVDVSDYVIEVWWRTGTGAPVADSPVTLPKGSVIPAGGVLCLVEGGTAGAAGPYPNSIYVGGNWSTLSSDNIEVLLLGPLGLLPLDYLESCNNENLKAFPSGNRPASLAWNGTFCSVGGVSADIIERQTLVDRDNAGDWVRAGLGTGSSPGSLNPVQASGCAGYFSQYGSGCMSTTYEPVLSGTGCPTAGGSITIELVFAPVAVPLLMVVGLGTGSAPLTPCCAVQVLPIGTTIPLFMPASALSLPMTIPVGFPASVDVHVQVLFADPGNPCGVSSTNPLQIHFQ